MLQTIVAFTALLATALAAPQSSAPAAPVYLDVAPAYTYQYAALDSDSGVNFGQTESRDAHATSGSYNVALPDGRIQTVTYRVDGDSGYIADVQYSGEARYDPAPANPTVVAHVPVAHPAVHHAVVAHPVAHAFAHPIAHPVFHG